MSNGCEEWNDLCRRVTFACYVLIYSSGLPLKEIHILLFAANIVTLSLGE